MSRSIFFAAAFFATSLFSMPEGFDLVVGNATPPWIDPHGTMFIDSQDRCIVNWSSFAIDAGEQVYFNQGGTDSAVLNRVVGDTQSNIYGRLSSNGAIYLINPNGILIGPKGRVEPSGLLASTFDISNQDFLDNAPLSFFGNSTNTVLNQGIVYCKQGNIVLCGLAASSTGVLSAPNGTVQILSGDQPSALFKMRGVNHVFFKIKSNEPRVADQPFQATKVVSSNGELHLVAP